MKKIVVILVVILMAFFLLQSKKTNNHSRIAENYPWQIKILANGQTRIFGVVLGENKLKDVDVILNSTPKVALFESKDKLVLEAFYKDIPLGVLSGSFIFTLDVPSDQLKKIKNKSIKQEPAGNNSKRYELDKYMLEASKSYVINDLIYIPTVQLDEDMIIKRFGKPTYKIKLKTKEIGWHYLYPEKGLDLIYKQDDKEVLQYVIPKRFNLLLEPLQSH